MASGGWGWQPPGFSLEDAPQLAAGFFTLGPHMRLRANLVYPAELDEGDVQAGVSENVVQETLSRVGKIVKTIFKSTSDIVQRAVSPKDRLLLKESETVEFLLAYHPYVIPIRSRSGKPHLPDGLIPMCFIRLHEQVRENAQEMLKSFSDAGIDLKVLAGSSPEEVFKTAAEMDMLLPDQTVETISTGDSLARLEPDGRREWIKSQELFADLDGFDKKGIIDTLRREGAYVSMAGDDMSDLEALGAADVTIALQSSALSVRSIADVILLRDSLMVLSNVLKEGQRVLNQVLDILKLFLTRLLYMTVLILVFSIFTEGIPLLSRQFTLISIATVDIPGVAIAFFMRARAIPSDRMVSRMRHFVIPSGITVAITGLILYKFFLTSTGDMAYARVMLLYGLVFMGLTLFIFVEPPFRFLAGGDSYSGEKRNLIVVAVEIFLLLIIGPTGLGDLLFGTKPIRQPQDLLVLLGVVAIWGMFLQVIWRVMLRVRSSEF